MAVKFRRGSRVRPSRSRGCNTEFSAGFSAGGACRELRGEVWKAELAAVVIGDTHSGITNISFSFLLSCPLLSQPVTHSSSAGQRRWRASKTWPTFPTRTEWK